MTNGLGEQQVKACPECGATGPIEALFGTRMMRSVRADGTEVVVERPQSWCRQCRSQSRKADTAEPPSSNKPTTGAAMPSQALPERYILWNYVLIERLSIVDAQDGFVLLTVTPRILALALSDAGEKSVGPGEAEADLVEAVRSAYQVVLNRGQDISAFNMLVDGVPASPAYLALSVLAGYHMRTDDDRTARAYYPRFAERLGVSLGRNNYPVGFNGPAFRELWQDLSRWLEESYGRTLTPPMQSIARHYVVYPLAHVPMRQVDIDRLPRFFVAYGYEPGARPPLDKLTYDLVAGRGEWREFTAAGQAALRDPQRRSLVVRQVAYELEHWDGLREDSRGRRVATIEVLMDIRRRRASLSLLARRPSGYPELLDDAEFAFEAAEPGWYDPVPLGPEDGDLLRAGIRVVGQGDDGEVVLQRPSSKVIPLVPAEDHTGHVSDRVLRRGADCAVLCTTDQEATVADYLKRVCRSECSSRCDPTLPAGWVLFMPVRAVEAVAVPAGLELLQVESSVKLVPQGGLRLGRHWSWLEGAPPTIRMLGGAADAEVAVDGSKVELVDGAIGRDHFGHCGAYVLTVGNQLRQRVRVVRAAAHHSCRDWDVPDAATRRAVPVPGGDWQIVGGRPGQRDRMSNPPGGALAEFRFPESWALRVGRRGEQACAVLLTCDEPEEPINNDVRLVLPCGVGSRAERRSWLQWSELVYQVSVRRHELGSSVAMVGVDVRARWDALKLRARRIKRALRGGP
ncbi:MAG: hypothetical protein H6739_06890 [Alphaproteobacteria bacterium]|nr:hypothetical protein [Alphaproteobacteria bacterium]